MMQEYMDGEDKVQTHLAQLLCLEEKRDEALEIFSKHQGVVKRWFKKMAKVKEFQILDLVLCWDKAYEKKGKHDKFDNLWKSPYQISEILGDNAFNLKTLIGKEVQFPINGKFLKHYFCP